MTIDVAIIDYGIGNLFSVRRAFEHVDANVVVSSDPALLLAAPRLVLPGVGAFADGMKGLQSRGLDQLVHEFVATGKPLLGICLGMQMLTTTSKEFGEHAGLNIIPGSVLPIATTGTNGKVHKIPHIGWTGLLPARPDCWHNSILQGLNSGDEVYLVHSFSVHPDHASDRLADCDYDGLLISAAITRDNVHGTQFHPEKSGKIGLRIIHNFSRLD